MNYIRIFFFLFALQFGLSVSDEEKYDAVAVLKGTEVDPDVYGIVKFKFIDKEIIDISFDIDGITNNEDDHIAIHIHEFGDISSSDASSAGGHFVGNGKHSHGCPNGELEIHSGDLGNFKVEDGAISTQKNYSLPKLTGKHSIIGRSVVVHQRRDDCETDPAGNSGPRIAYGVIGILSDIPYSDFNAKYAVCDFSTTNESPREITGRAYFKQEGKEVHVYAEIRGLKGTHGFHVHELGDISDEDKGMNTKAHYNPFNKSHGLPHQKERHVGDLGNIEDQGDKDIYYYNRKFELNITGKYGIIGRSMIIHEKKDDGTGDTGNAGKRYAQCVIGISPEFTIPEKEKPTSFSFTYYFIWAFILGSIFAILFKIFGSKRRSPPKYSSHIY